MKMEISFQADMTCCKSTRISAGLTCRHAVHMSCACRQAGAIALAKGGRGLDAFARHLLVFWPLCDVYWVFAGAGQMSTLAEICKERWLQLPAAARGAYRDEVAAATAKFRVECGSHNPSAFMATFDLLCETAMERS
ncbi:hypothetical protein [Cupriavidus basilensis]|uniref:hypothetical protein n=1 Tax=Cupriavidus basilensis TaxID=68895 RepID=UPI00283CD732|nr:hypothetical protein [Cupriavidus basilensis]MDR3382293.1 hypothetical protein [Cupriavidus basilensis]